MQHQPTHGSLFSGIGGNDLAAQRAGYVNIYNCEINPYCRKVLQKNFPASIQFTDVRKANPPYTDVISGGFPCQDISLAKTWTTQDKYAQNGIKGKRSSLWFSYYRIIKEKKPLFVVAENVPTLTKQGLDQVLHSLAKIGYNAEWQTISAASFGATHRRNRIFIVAYPQRIGRKQTCIVFGKEFSQAIRDTQGRQLSRAIRKNDGKTALPSAFGIHDGLPVGLDRAERMTALGNAVYPPIPELIFNTIKPLIHQYHENN